ncbi:MAG: hypothetical protein HY674_00260 [Chloroflexi bacterium]|nr:hypothetical protein [Chloroflexota bacterium]
MKEQSSCHSTVLRTAYPALLPARALTLVELLVVILILLLVDDRGWPDASVPLWTEVTPLNRKVHTPNMQRLAATGMKFTQALGALGEWMWHHIVGLNPDDVTQTPEGESP